MLLDCATNTLFSKERLIFDSRQKVNGKMAVFEVTFPLVLLSSDQFARPQKQHDNNAETTPQNDDEQ